MRAVFGTEYRGPASRFAYPTRRKPAMKPLLILIPLALLFAVAAPAANVDGKWQATVTTPRGESQVTFDFKANGETLTGTVTNPMGESEIQEGKISGDDVSFKQVFERGDRKITFVYTGKVKGSEIEFTRKAEGFGGGGGGGGRGPGRETTFTAKKM
jgi:hypothetical protein